jgi:hypothetical protein
MMLGDVLARDDAARPSHACGGVIAGTPVWTDRGRVPIEQLKVGDNVLSQPESTGERAYRKVLRMFCCEDKAILCVRYCLPPPDDTEIHYEYVTCNHPFWVKRVGWTRADLFEGGEELELHDGRTAYVLEGVPLYKTDRPNIDWMPEYSHSVDGFEIDFSGGKVWWLDEQDQRNFGKSLGSLLTTVYAIEVEGFHTCYVGELGVWVHNAHGAGIERFATGSGVPSGPAMQRSGREMD